jgi:hypothetical protein
MQKVNFFIFLNVLINEILKLQKCKNMFDDLSKIFSKKTFVLFQSAQHFMGKGKDPDPKPDPGGLKHTCPTDPDPDENPEHCRGGYYITLQYVSNSCVCANGSQKCLLSFLK